MILLNILVHLTLFSNLGGYAEPDWEKEGNIVSTTVSNIRNKDLRPPLFVLRQAQGPAPLPPCILKWGGLESSGGRLISLNSKTKSRGMFGVNYIFFKTRFKTKTMFCGHHIVLNPDFRLKPCFMVIIWNSDLALNDVH